jgi:probable rRNA maturation factor
MTPAATICVLSPCTLWGKACQPAVRLVRNAARRALRRGAAASRMPLPPRVELCINLADDARQRRLNRDYRGLDMPTNVLAFPAWTPGERVPPEAPLLLGDVVLALETVTREAQEQQKPFVDHLRHLTVHGVLHLLGYDHLAPDEAATMEALESSILAGLGVPDPYGDSVVTLDREPISR